MESSKIKQVQRADKSHRVIRPNQTGFSSPATHYAEPRIDLNDALIENPSATFYVRVSDNSFSEFSILEKDVLIIDKSITPNNNQLVVITVDGAFQIARIDLESQEEMQLWGVITYIIKSTL